jgi:hypothetical protein
VRVGRAVLAGVLVVAAGKELYHPMNINVQGFKLLTHDALRCPLAEVLYQEPHTTVLWK